MTNTMSRHITSIANILGIAADRARLVVGYLRSEYRTLDGISRQQIRADYGSWIGATIDANIAMADQLAASYGL
jgi:hypothetical protein